MSSTDSAVLASALGGADPMMAAGMKAMETFKSAGGGPSTATGMNQSGFDASGWNVNFGNGEISSSATKQDPIFQTSNLSNYAPLLVLAVAAIVVLKMVKKRG